MPIAIFAGSVKALDQEHVFAARLDYRDRSDV